MIGENGEPVTPDWTLPHRVTLRCIACNASASHCQAVDKCCGFCDHPAVLRLVMPLLYEGDQA